MGFSNKLGVEYFFQRKIYKFENQFVFLVKIIRFILFSLIFFFF